jgi:hypothetical protein
MNDLSIRQRLKARGNGLEQRIKEDLRKRDRDSSERVDHSLIVQSLKKQRRAVDPQHDVSRSIIYRLKEDYKRQNEPVLDVSKIDNGYRVLVNDESIQNPFIISSGLVKTIRRYTKNCNSQEETARAIFDWMQQNIQYGDSKRKNGYKNSEEVINQGQGVCGEMAFLYITMARCCGLKSAYVSVEEDSRGKKVHHACAVVDVGYRDLFVDPAYHSYDVNHQKFKVLTDAEVLVRFNQWRVKGGSIWQTI